MKEPDGIDAVVTWVDPTDSAWRALLRRHASGLAAEQATPDSPRYRDPGTLRYCLRGIALNMPWVRRIVLVTAGHTPDWLDTGHRRLRLVPHAGFFPDSRHLPTFNSLAIEANLHRIDGLSNVFLYLNDDVIVLRPAPPDRFVTADGGHLLPFEAHPLPTDLRAADANDRSLAFTNLLLRPQRARPEQRLRIPHIPQVYDRDWIAWLWSGWPADLARTSSQRFRRTDGVALRALYYHAIYEMPGKARPGFAAGRSYPARLIGPSEQRFIWTRCSLASFARSLTTAADATFVCLNDDTSDPAEAARFGTIIRWWLESRLPTPAPWELDAHARGGTP